MHKRLGLQNWLKLGVVIVVAVSGTGGTGRAQAQTSLPVLLAQPKQLRIDGDLGEWRGARFVRLGDDDAGRSELALAHDEQGLYVGARVYDDNFVRSAHPGPDEDAVVVTLALPAAGSFVTSELWLFAGRIGQSAASLQLSAAGTKQLRALGHGAQIVEGPLAKGSGYVVEAYVPWSNLPHGDNWSYARGAARLNDVDRASRPAHVVPADALGKPGSRLPWLLFDGGPVEAMRGFFDQKNLASTPALLDWVGDVRDDAHAERVVVVGTFVLRSAEAGNFTFADLPVTRAADVRAAEMIDLTGDGKPELVLRLRNQQEQTESEVWRVFDVGADPMQSRFAIETRKQSKRGSLEAHVTVAAGRPAQITVRAGPAHGITAADYVETAVHGVVAMPVPWGPWLERTYAWDGSNFALKKERANPAAQTAADTEPESSAQSSAAHASTGAAANTNPSPPLGAAVSEADLLQGYRSARGVPSNQAARFSQHADVAGDSRAEALAVFGRDCVVVGAGFRGGRDFFFFTLPARADGDVLQVSTADFSGDGRADLLARVRQTIGSVTREIVYLYTFAGENLAPLLAVEVRRAEGAHSITNSVSLVPDGKRVKLRVAPGVAKGWSASDYPFSADTRDGVAPLLLPWMDKPTEYQYDGQRLVPRLSKN